MKRYPRLRRFARTALVLSAISTLLLLILVSNVHAELQDRLWKVGEVLTPMAADQDDDSGAPRTLSVNGTEIVIRSQTVTTSIKETLDAAEETCAGYRVGRWSSTIRDQNLGGGFVACFPKLREVSSSEAYDLVQAYIDDGDLSGLGPMNYTYARATRTGTHRLEATVDGLNLDSFAPSKGDAPGSDVVGVPRPAGARRLFSALELDQTYHLAIYSGTPGTPEEVRDGFRDRLEEGGWSIETTPSTAKTAKREALVALRDGRMVVVTFIDRGGSVSTTIASGM